MNYEILGVYREIEYSPGKVDADRAVMDAVLAHLRDSGGRTAALEASAFIADPPSKAQLVLAMCQGADALHRLVAIEEGGALVINSALAIRNCYRDLLGMGLTNARIPAPPGVVIDAASRFDLKALQALDLSRPVYVKRGDLHALTDEDVMRVSGWPALEAALKGFAARGIGKAYVQQEVAGPVVKFYGVGTGADYFSAIAPGGVNLSETIHRELTSAAGAAATALGLEVWGGDAVVADGRFSIVDFNDWPSFELVRDAAALSIARRCVARMKRQAALPQSRGSSGV
jgi:glutathione synthase/RimK-type ligase-like ATP-grasp enzyme